jgi:hypothetical protein
MNRTPIPGTPVTVTTVALLAVTLACSDPVPTAPYSERAEVEPQMLINGVDDFGHDATAAIMVYDDPNQTGVSGWRSFCTGVLVHQRVIQTAGHCIQFMQQQLDAGTMKAVWISFQHDPRAHFNADPALHNPASGGWYEVESLRNNPDNIDFVQLRQSPPEEVLAVWGKFHDTGAIVLKKPVKGIKPVEMARRPGSVKRLLRASQCEHPNAKWRNRFCKLLDVSYGLQEFPPTADPPEQVRHSALLRYKGIDAKFIATFDDPPGGDFGANCLGDSGSPVWLLKPNGKDRIVIAISSSPADPFGPPCATGALQYRTDTRSHQRFIRGVIESVRCQSNRHSSRLPAGNAASGSVDRENSASHFRDPRKRRCRLGEDRTPLGG